MRILHHKITATALVLCVLIGAMYLLGIFQLSLADSNIYISPDENTTNIFIHQYAQTGSLALPQTYTFPESYTLTPRSAVAYANQIVPILPFGLNIIAGTFAMAHPVLGIIIVPVMLIGLIALQYLLLKQFIPFRQAVIGALLIALLPPFIHFGSRSRVLDIPMLYMFSLGVYFFFKSKLTVRRDLLVSGLFLASALFINQKSLFWVMALAASQFIYLTALTIQTQMISVLYPALRSLLYLTIGALPMLVLILYGNYRLYNSPVKNGYMVQTEVNAAIGAAPKPLFFIELDKLWFNNTNYLFGSFVPVLGVLMVIGSFYVLRFPQAWLTTSYTYFFISLFAITTLYFSNIANWGSAAPTLTASYLRYLLPIFFFGMVFCLEYTFRFIDKSYLKIMVPVLVILLHLSFFIGPGGYAGIRSYVNGMIPVRSFVVANTPETGIIFTNSLDKILYPYRHTVNFQSMPVISEANLYPDAPTLIRLIHQLPPQSQLYYLEEDPDFTAYFTNVLTTNEFGLQRLKTQDAITLYAIDR